MTSRKLSRRKLAIVLLTFVVAGAVGVESWHAAADAAHTGERPWPWLWPVTLEAFIAVLVLVYWEARSEGRRAGWARGLLFLTTALASSVQALDAWDAGNQALAVLTAAWTPVALLLTVEFATWLLYGDKADPAREPGPAPVVGERAAGATPPRSAPRATTPPDVVEPGPAPSPRSRPTTKAGTITAAQGAKLDRAKKQGAVALDAKITELGLDRDVVLSRDRWSGNGHAKAEAP